MRPFESITIDLLEPRGTEGCKRLISKLKEHGAKSPDDVFGISVSLEDFFEGNFTKSSIAANTRPDPPYDQIEGWYSLLKDLRSNEKIADIKVQIQQIELYKGGVLRDWPYAETIWIYTSLKMSELDTMLSPIQPSETQRVITQKDLDYFKPPFQSSRGLDPVWVWWD